MQWIPGNGKLIRIVFFFAPFLLAGSTVFAASPRYDYIEGGWLRVDPDAAGSDSGVFLGGSFAVRSFQFFAEYGDPGDFETWNIGGGWHGLLGERADLVLQGAYVDADFDDGLRLTAGIRWMVLEKLEVNWFLNYTDLDLTDSTAIAANGIWDLTPRLGVGGGYEAGDEGDTARAFARFNFGKQK